MPLIKILSDPSAFKMHTDSGDFEQKSMKFGDDERGSGESKQSKFLNKINTPPIPEKIPFIGIDYVLRGGLKLPKLILNDLKRFGNFITSPEGILFVTKQNLLIRQQSKFPNSPPLELDKAIKPGRIWQPISTGLQIGGNAFGVHVLGKGLGPVNDIVKLIKKAGDGGDVTNDTETQDSTNRYLYQQKQWYNDVRIPKWNGGGVDGEISITNRLGLLYASKIINPGGLWQYGGVQENSLAWGLGTNAGLKADVENQNILLKYSGGPNAIVPGISNSTYKRTTFTNNWNDVIGTGGKLDGTNQRFCVLSNRQLYYYAYSHRIGPDAFGGNILSDFRKNIVKDAPDDNLMGVDLEKNSIASKSLTYTEYGGAESWNRTNWKNGVGYGLGDPGQRGLNRTDFVSGAFSSTDKTDFPGIDKINFSPIIHAGGGGGWIEGDDLVNFHIDCIDNDNSPADDVRLFFRAFVDGFSDSYTANWAGTKMLGRGEQFYTYGGFDRKISFNFKVHAQSKQEMKRMYSKLNYLASLCAPDYNEVGGWPQGFMRGNLIKITLGDYLYEQIGILGGFTLSIDDSTPWDIGRNKTGEGDQTAVVMPHGITVSGFSFIPICNFLPKKVSKKYVTNQISENIQARYINLGEGGWGYNTENELGISDPYPYPNEKKNAE